MTNLFSESLAYMCPAYQTGVYDTRYASLAVDDPTLNTFADTNYHTDPWWIVQLPYDTFVSTMFCRLQVCAVFRFHAHLSVCSSWETITWIYFMNY